MTGLQSLAEVLRAENKLIESLLRLGEEKQAAINDANRIAQIAELERGLIAELDKADQERAMLYDVVALGQPLDEWLGHLESDKNLFTQLTSDLVENIARFRSLNEINQQLLTESLDFVRYSLNMLTDSTSPTYARTGNASQGKSTFDRKV